MKKFGWLSFHLALALLMISQAVAAQFPPTEINDQSIVTCRGVCFNLVEGEVTGIEMPSRPFTVENFRIGDLGGPPICPGTITSIPTFVPFRNCLFFDFVFSPTMPGVFSDSVTVNWTINDTPPQSFSFTWNLIGEGFGEPEPSLRPVVVMPGILGTQLFHGNDLIWPNRLRLLVSPSDDFLNVLSVDEHGGSINSIQTGGLLREFPFSDFYNGLIEQLEDAGYQEGSDLFTFAYDWRLDNREAAERLNASIAEILAQTGARMVDLVAHSMAGLVARDYVARFGASTVGKIVYIATPHSGSVNSFNALAFDNPLSEHFLKIPLVNARTLSTLSREFPSVYELLPRAPFLLFQGRTLSLEATYVDEFNGRPFMATTHMERASQFAEEIFGDTNIDSVEEFAVAGSGAATLGGLRLEIEEDGEQCWDPQTTNGDDTVSILSAGALPTSGEVIYRDSKAAFLLFGGAGHSKLPNDRKVGELVARILTTGDPRDDAGHFPAGISDTAFPVGKTLNWRTCSPVMVEILDSLGNRNGLDAEGHLDQEIPLSNFFLFDSNEAGFLPAAERYTINLDAFENGAFTLTIRTEEGNAVISEVEYRGVPIAEGSRGRLELKPDDPEPLLFLDIEGDGLEDFSILANTTPEMNMFVAVLSHIVIPQ